MASDPDAPSLIASLQDLLTLAPHVGRLIYQRLLGETEAARAVVNFIMGARSGGRADAPVADGVPLKPPTASGLDVRLFSWQLSYFSGKVRAYLRFKRRGADRVRWDDVLASPELVADLLLPQTQTNVVPQVQLPSGEFVQDSTEIIETLERLFPKTPVIPPAPRHKQRLVCKLLELFGDEWLITAAFHWRWAYSGDDAVPIQRLHVPPGAKAAYNKNHRAYNALQWGRFLDPTGKPPQRKRSGELLFDHIMFPAGAKRGLLALGVTSPALARAFEASTTRFLRLFEDHLETGASFVLGHRPSLADYGLCGPLYAHLFQDPVPGFDMRTRFPLVAAWCERLHDRGGQFEAQRAVRFDPARGELVEDRSKEHGVGGGAGHDGIGEWYADDDVPDTVLAMVRCFFDEQWPVLASTTTVLTDYLATRQRQRRSQSSEMLLLPGKSFGPSGQSQFAGGPLTHRFALGGESGSRMVVPYQVWMMQGLCDDYLLPAIKESGAKHVAAFLAACGDDAAAAAAAAAADKKKKKSASLSLPSLLELPRLISRCRVVKRGGRIYADPKNVVAARL